MEFEMQYKIGIRENAYENSIFETSAILFGSQSGNNDLNTWIPSHSNDNNTFYHG